MLDTETVIEDAGQTVNFQVSPNGRLLALDAWPDPLTVIDMASRERWIRQGSAEDYLLFWGDNESVFIQSGVNAD